MGLGDWTVCIVGSEGTDPEPKEPKRQGTANKPRSEHALVEDGFRLMNSHSMVTWDGDMNHPSFQIMFPTSRFPPKPDSQNRTVARELRIL